MSKNIVNGEYGARSLCLSTTVICLFVFCLDANTIAIARAEEKPAETMSKLERTCFAGIFFDTRSGEQSSIVKSLVQPVVDKDPDLSNRSILRGNELTPLGWQTIEEKIPEFVEKLHMDKVCAETGNPVAILVRAEDQTVSWVSEELGTTLNQTTIYMTLFLDVFTDQAAMRRTKRFESLYTHMHRHILNFKWQEREHLDLNDAYRSVFVGAPSAKDCPKQFDTVTGSTLNTNPGALVCLAAGVLQDLNEERQRSRAVFQVNDVKLPSKIPEEFSLILEGSAQNLGHSSESSGRESALEHLRQELMHQFHRVLRTEIRSQGENRLVLLPPESPWTQAHLVKLLQDRITGLDESVIISSIDVTKMNGYHVTGALVNVKDIVVEESSALQTKILGIQMAGRLYRPDVLGGKSKHVPSSIDDPRQKTVVAEGGDQYYQPKGNFFRSALRDKAFRAINDSYTKMANEMVGLMKQTAEEINR